eukprot:scaffold45119_cov49-Attheya_sp.AAC.2
MTVEKGTVLAFPWEFLFPDRHVIWLGSNLSMCVFLKENILCTGANDQGDSDKDGNLDPLPHLFHLLGLGLVRGLHNVLLSCDPSLKLRNGLRLHILFCSHTGHRHCITARPSTGGGNDGTAANSPGGNAACNLSPSSEPTNKNNKKWNTEIQGNFHNKGENPNSVQGFRRFATKQHQRNIGHAQVLGYISRTRPAFTLH